MERPGPLSSVRATPGSEITIRGWSFVVYTKRLTDKRRFFEMPYRESFPVDDPLWYKDVIIYELHVKAFFDSNADGIGDFRGLIEKLDYLENLGVTALWLLPFYPSPLRMTDMISPITWDPPRLRFDKGL